MKLKTWCAVEDDTQTLSLAGRTEVSIEMETLLAFENVDFYPIKRNSVVAELRIVRERGFEVIKAVWEVRGVGGQNWVWK